MEKSGLDYEVIVYSSMKHDYILRGMDGFALVRQDPELMRPHDFLPGAGKLLG